MLHVKLSEALTYQDVLLVPQYSDIRSRSEVDISSHLSKDLLFDLPIISSPMDTVTGPEMIGAMSKHGGFGTLHRYCSIEDQVSMVNSSNGIVAAAIGVTGDFKERAEALVSNDVKILCVDVAHGHHITVKEALRWLKDSFKGIHVIAGNIATVEGFDALADWGADSIRCNIGGGSICVTRVQTGHGVPGLQTIIDCASSVNANNVSIIADGGVRNSGDIVKALAAGADFVMLGSLLAGTDESPGGVLEESGKKYKIYRGMASREAQNEWRGRSSSPEGVVSTIPYKGSVHDILTDLAGGIRSGLSYSGARSIHELRAKARFIRQTMAGQEESSAHIFKR